MAAIWRLLCIGLGGCTMYSPPIEVSPVTVSSVAPTLLSAATGGTLEITGTGFGAEILDADTDQPDVRLPTVTLFDGDVYALDAPIPNSAGTALTVAVRPDQLPVATFTVRVSNFEGDPVEAGESVEVGP